MNNDVPLLANWRQIAKDLTEQISDGRLQDGERLPSEFVLADRMGVSRQTVHRALAELKRQGLVARQRRLGTTVSRTPRRRFGMVALIMDYANDFPQAELVRGIQAGLPEGEGVLLFDVGNDPATEAERLRRAAASADGVFLYPSCHPDNTPVIANLAAAGISVVCIDRMPDGLTGVEAVVTDNHEVSLRGMQALIAAGHRRILFLSGDNDRVSSVAERHAAYRTALEEIGAYDPALERWFPKSLEAAPDRLRTATEDALYRLSVGAEPPTAAFCVQDLYAATGREVADRLGLELEWLTFNDWPSMMLPRYESYHRIVQNPFEMGRVAAERFHARQEGEELAPQRLLIRADLFPPSPLSSPLPRAAGRSSARG